MGRLGVAGVTLALLLTPGVAMAEFDSHGFGADAPPAMVARMNGHGVRMNAPPMAQQLPPPQTMPQNAPPPMRPMAPPPGAPPMPAPMSPPPGAPMSMHQGMQHQGMRHQDGPRAARWGNVPGGWQAYRRPSYGYQLPGYWTSAPYYIESWSNFGLPRPAPGFGWSRYYDDAVLTDQYGRVYDSREGIDWSRDERWRGEDYSDSYGYRDERRDGEHDGQRDGRDRGGNGVAGAAIGAVVGGVAGNIIGGDGNRLAGTLIGGGVGAIAGAAIGDASRHHHDERIQRREYRSYGNGFNGGGHMHWHGGGTTVYQDGYAGGGYGGTTVTTTIIEPSAPVMTRSVRYVSEYVRVPVRHVRKWKPRPKPSCVCGS